MNLLNIHTHSRRFSLALLALTLPACSPSPWHSWVSVALSPRCHVLLLPRHSAAPPAHRARLARGGSCSRVIAARRQRDSCFFMHLGGHGPVFESNEEKSPLPIAWRSWWFFFQDGMGNLRLEQEGIRLEGISEFLLPLYVNEIRSRRVSCSLLLFSSNFQLAVDQYSVAQRDQEQLPFAETPWEMLPRREISPKLILSRQFWGSCDQFIYNKANLPLTWWYFDVTL